MLRPTSTVATAPPPTNIPSSSRTHPSSSSTTATTTTTTRKLFLPTCCVVSLYVITAFILMVWVGGKAAHELDANTQQQQQQLPSALRRISTVPKISSPNANDPFTTFDQCQTISRLISSPSLPSAASQGLPESGKVSPEQHDSIVFWLKRPILKLSDPSSLLLKYNKYLPLQHTIKWSNTVSVLGTFSHRTSILPRLYGHCRDPGDKHHYVQVEWIEARPSALPKPQTFQQCFTRMQHVMEALVILDEDLHLGLFDVKPGQWMSRTLSVDHPDVVFQDADDIVPAPWKSIADARYADQIEHAIHRLQWANSNLFPSYRDAHRAWHVDLFPDHTYTIRYTMILLSEIIELDMGFNWRHDCSVGQPPSWQQCFDKVMKWTATGADDWPAPKQALEALQECRQNTFVKSIRPAASWRDVSRTTMTTREPYIAPSACVRAYDGGGDNKASVRMCGEGALRSCCRAKGTDLCYYTVSDQSLCG